MTDVNTGLVLRTTLRDTVCTGRARLVLVRAPAGYGKTTLLTQCRQHLEAAGVPTPWLTLDSSHNDPARFLAQVRAMVDDALPEFDVVGAHSPRPYAPAAGLGEQALSLADRLAGAQQPFALFLDEFEVVVGPSVLAVVRDLLDRLPPGGRIVIGTRNVPDLGLSRLRARGALVEVDAQQLRFTLPEARIFFAARLKLSLATEDLAVLHRKIEGWVAALWLVGLALQRHEEHGTLIARISGTDAGIATYLAEEVLAQQDEALRNFLLRTSVSRELTVPLAQSLLPHLSSDEVARLLSAAEAFLIPLEGRADGWRYHSLFASFLQGQLRRQLPDEVPVLHAAAARWFSAQGQDVQAVDHLIESGDLAAAVEAMSRVATALLAQGRLGLLKRWFDRIPDELLRERPQLLVVQLWALVYRQGPQAALARLREVDIEGVQDRQVRVHVAALRVAVGSLLDRWEQAYEAGRPALPLLPSGSAYADASLVNSLASAAIVLGDYPEARRLLDMAHRAQSSDEDSFYRRVCEVSEGLIDWAEGRLRQARARFRLAVQGTQVSGFGPAQLNVWGGLMLARTHYENNEVQSAERLVQLCLPLAREVWLPDHIILGHTLMSRIAFLRGDVDLAFQHLSELEHLGDQRQLARLSASARVERARLLLQQRHLEAAATELERAQDAAVWREVTRHRHLAHDQEDLGVGMMRWNLFAMHLRRAPLHWRDSDSGPLPDIGQAVGDLAQALAQAVASRFMRRALKLRWMHAIALALDGQPGAAVEQAVRALREACAEGALRTLIDEGRPAAMLLLMVRQARAQAGPQASDPILDDFIHTLIDAMGPVAVEESLPAQALRGTTGPAARDKASPSVEAPTPKELRILELLAEGYSNQALAEKLSVSDSTVRTHLRKLNGKLGAANRTQAVAIARRMGWIR